MRIVNFHPPTESVSDIPAVGPDGARYTLVAPSSLIWVAAVSTRGRRYRCAISDEGASCVFREDPVSGFWRQIEPPRALQTAARKFFREAGERS
jgi:hypothetical protein